MRQVLSMLLCVLTISTTPILAVFRGRGDHSRVGRAPEWLENIAATLKHRSSAADTPKASLDVEPTAELRSSVVDTPMAFLDVEPKAERRSSVVNTPETSLDAEPTSKLRSSVADTPEASLDVEPTTAPSVADRAAGDGTTASASEVALTSAKGEKRTSSKGPEWLRARFPSLATPKPAAAPVDEEVQAPTPLDPEADSAPTDSTPLHPDVLLASDSSADAAAPAASSKLTKAFLSSLIRTSASSHFDEKKVVWVTAYPRSGSSTILAMLSPPKRESWKSFTAFEPCVGRGFPWKQLMKEGCENEVRRITRCDYTGIEHIGVTEKADDLVLYDADDVNAPSLSGAQAAAACAAADVVALKTITYAHDLTEVLPMLEADNRIRILDVVRDPRGIYASWLSTEPFRGLVTGQHKPYWRRHDQGWFSNLTGICDHFQKNLHTPHPQVRRVLFENLIKDPESVVRHNYEWLGLPFDDAASLWINATFNARCSKENPFSTCRGNSSASLLKWKEVLPIEEQAAFVAHPACREIAVFYGYPL